MKMNFLKQLAELFNFLKDDTGKYSSLRILLFVILLIFIYLMNIFNKFVEFELNSEAVNYTGLVALFSAFFISFLFAIFAKVFQKKYENIQDYISERRRNKKRKEDDVAL